MLNKLRPELVTLCKNNADLLKRRVIPYHSLQDKGLSGIDYEFFCLTEKKKTNITFVHSARNITIIEN